MNTILRLQFVKQLFANNSTVLLRTYIYDANGWGTYLNGRVARVDYGAGKWSELYSYNPAGGRTAKRLSYTWVNNQTSTTQNLDAIWTYNNEGQVVSVKYPDTSALNNNNQPITITGNTYAYTFDAMARPTDLTATMGDGTGSFKQAQGATYGPRWRTNRAAIPAKRYLHYGLQRRLLLADIVHQ